MSVSSLQSSTGGLVGNNSTTTGYVVPFAFQLPSDLVVVRRDSSGNVYSLGVGTDYTVSQNPDLSGGTVYTTAPWDSTNTLVISRVVPLTQLLNLIPGAKEPAAAITQAFDKLTYIAQQLSRNSAPDTITASGVGPYVLGLATPGGAPYWVPQSSSAIGIGSILYTQLAGSIPPSKLSLGAPTWDALGNLSANNFVGPLSGNVTGNVTGNAGTANTAANASNATPSSSLAKSIAKAWVAFTAPAALTSVSFAGSTSSQVVSATKTNHNLNTGDCITIFNQTGNNVSLQGTWVITRVDANTFTFTITGTPYSSYTSQSIYPIQIFSSYNIASVAPYSTTSSGIYVVTFPSNITFPTYTTYSGSTATQNNAYWVLGSFEAADASAAWPFVPRVSSDYKTGSSFRIKTVYEGTSPTFYDPPAVFISVLSA